MDLFTTNSMMKAVDQLPMSNLFLLKRFFPLVQMEDGEKIHFDVTKKTRRLAPFVSPLKAGKIVESEGIETNTFTPAYIKDKRVFDANRPLKRMAGEAIGGTFKPGHRIERLVVNELADQINMVDRRLEIMAAEVLLTGKSTITGSDYPTQNIDFNRDPDLTTALSGADLWSDPASTPLDDLQDWAQLVLQKSGISPKDVILSVDVWKVFRKHSDVVSNLDRPRSNSTIEPDAMSVEGGEFMGTIDGFNIFVYSGWYVDDAGVEQQTLPDGTAILTTPKLEGVRAFGAILDNDAGYRAYPYFPKSWTTDDPSIRYLLMQSAPLVVPTRVDTTLFSKVL